MLGLSFFLSIPRKVVDKTVKTCHNSLKKGKAVVLPCYRVLV